MKFKRVFIILISLFAALVLLSLLVIYLLGGAELVSYLQTSLYQAYGLGLALTALLFFFVLLVWRLQMPLLLLALLGFLIGAGMFVSVSVGRLYMFQYPMFVQSFGPAEGPGLPLKNALAFFKNIQHFKKVADIARDPNDVPPALPPLTKVETNSIYSTNDSSFALPAKLSTVESAHHHTEEMTMLDILETVDETAVPEESGEVRKIYLETAEVLAEVAPNIYFNYWTFGETVPGPMLRVREGDIVEVTIHNRAENLHPHNIDLHAATGPGGGGEVSVVAPGETKTFYFKALNPGLFVYHCAVPNMAVHMAHGMYGMILVEPKEGLPPVDKEFYIMQGELFTAGALGRHGLQIFDAKKMLQGIPEYVLFNGRPNGLNGKMQAKVGDKIRFYIGNSSVVNSSSIHLVGEIFDTVYPEASIGGALFKNVQTTNVPAGGATMVEFTVDYPGDYVLVDHALMRTDKGAWGVLTVTGEANPEIYNGEFSPEGAGGHSHGH